MNGDIEVDAGTEVVTDGLRILCFDGGGVRGKASLLLLKELMGNIGQGAKPCNFFDLIAGTSTGALIAIMLARLEYTVEEAIQKYDTFGRRIFSKRASDDTQWVMRGIPLVPEGPAEEVFQEVGRVDGEDAFMGTGHNNRCKCLVTTVLQDCPGVLVPIRSYHISDRADPVSCSGKQWKIWEAARAATAAPVYFKPFELATIPGRTFIDAGAGYNNPSIEVYHEITRNITEYKDKPIACFVSIGTGVRSRPAPDVRGRKFSTSFLGPAKDRAADLIKYLADIASNTTKVHNEMNRLHGADEYYFRFDPGSQVGLIDLADVSMLRIMENLVWDHIRDEPTITVQLQRCSNKLKAASLIESQLVVFSEPNPDIEPLRPIPNPTSNRGSQNYGWARTLPSFEIQRDWFSITELVDVTIGDPGAGLAFLAIFSLSNNFEHVLEAFNAKYYSSTDTSDTQVYILMLVTKFVSNLWLTDRQISKISELFVTKPHLLPIPLAACMALQQHSLTENLQIAGSINAPDLEDPFSTPTDLKTFAKELAEALAVLEDGLRRTDPVCECARWLARRCAHDFLAFPERVKNWILQSILLAKGETIKQRYQLFYKVAKRSKEIYNFSAMQAILSALHFLEKLRIGIGVETSDLQNMMRLDRTQQAQQAKLRNKPCLHCIQDILPSGLVDISMVADTRHQINWLECRNLLVELERFTSLESTQFTSTSKYVFSQDRVTNFVKKSLINVTIIDNIEGRVQVALRRYNRAQQKPPRLWRKP